MYSDLELRGLPLEKLQETISYIKELQNKTPSDDLIYSIRKLYLQSLEMEVRDRISLYILEDNSLKDTLFMQGNVDIEKYIVSDITISITILDDIGNLQEKTVTANEEGFYETEFIITTKSDLSYTVTRRILNNENEIIDTLVIRRKNINMDKGNIVTILQLDDVDNTITSPVDLLTENIFSLEKLKEIASNLSYSLLVEKDTESILYNLRLYYLELINKEIKNRLSNGSANEIYKNLYEKYIIPSINPDYKKAEFSSSIVDKLNKIEEPSKKQDNIILDNNKSFSEISPVFNSLVQESSDKNIKSINVKKSKEIVPKQTGYIPSSDKVLKSDDKINIENSSNISDISISNEKEESNNLLSSLGAINSKNNIKEDYIEDTINTLDTDNSIYSTAFSNFIVSYSDVLNNLNDSDKISKLKLVIKEYSDLIVNCPIFSNIVNKEDLSKLLKVYLTDLYIIEPNESLDYLEQKPSQRMINSLFANFGIRKNYINNFPDVLKNKTAFNLNKLFNNKGNNKVFEIFHEIIKEYYEDLNFYNVVVSESDESDSYENVSIQSAWYGKNALDDKFYKSGDFLEMYWDRYNKTSGNVPYITSETVDVTTYKDESIECKIFYTALKRRNKIKYHIKLFYPAYNDITMTLNYGTPFIIEKGESEKIVEFDIGGDIYISNYRTIDTKKIYYIDTFYNDDNELDYEFDSSYGAVSDNVEDENYKNKDNYKDPELNVRVRSNILDNNIVEYILIFKDSSFNTITLLKDIIIKLEFPMIENSNDENNSYNYLNNEFIIESNNDVSEYRFQIDFTGSSFQNDKNLKSRSAAQLKYTLEPLYLSDPDNAITELNSSDINVAKYYMEKDDFFDTDYKNKEKKNIFPIKTNIIYMQVNSSGVIDNMDMLPELIDAYALTYLQYYKINITVNNYITQIDFVDYIDILLYVRLKEVTLGYSISYLTIIQDAKDSLLLAESNYNEVLLNSNSTKEEILDVTLDLEEAKKTVEELNNQEYDYIVNKKLKDNCNKELDLEKQKIENICVRYNSSVYDFKNIEDIQALMVYYNDMKPTYKQLQEFTINFNKLRLKDSQQKKVSVISLLQFRENLIGNVPDNWKDFRKKLDDFFPDIDNNIKQSSTNKLLKTKIDKQYLIYKETNKNENILEFYDSLIQMESDQDFDNLDNSVGTYLNQKFIRKYPRLISEIDNLDIKDIGSFYLYNFKNAQSFMKKEDQYIQTFINQLFYGYLLGSAFKKNIFNPAFNLFKQYFFKAELTMKNDEYIKKRIRDKTNVVRLDSENRIRLEIDNRYSELNISDNAQIDIKYSRYPLSELTDYVTIKLTFDEQYNNQDIKLKYVDEENLIDIEYNSSISNNECVIEMLRIHFVNYFNDMLIGIDTDQETLEEISYIDLIRTDEMNKKELRNIEIDKIANYSRLDEEDEEYFLVEILEDIDDYKIVRYKI